SLEQLARARGIQLTRRGKDLFGLCPWHPDKNPSLSIDPSGNRFHCFGCGVKGSVIDWVMKTFGVGVGKAIELLRAEVPLISAGGPTRIVKRASVPLLPCPLDFHADDQTLVSQSALYYHGRLRLNSNALAYLAKRGLTSDEAIDHFKIGYVDRSLGWTIPEKNRKDGAAIRERLEKLGILRKKTGHECYRGMLTIPTFDEDGKIVGLYGRRATDALGKGELKHLNLPGHLLGLINRAAFASTDEIILCEAPLDALTFWVAGYRNVTCSFGTNGFTDTHREAFERHGIRRVLIAYDRDEAGEAAAAALAAELLARGIECYRILFPKGMDANDYARKVTPTAKSLGIAIRRAEWLGGGAAPQRGPGAVSAPVPGLLVAMSSSEAMATSPAIGGDGTAESPSLAAGAPAASDLESTSSDAAESGTPDNAVSKEPITPSALPTPEPPAASPVPAAPKPALACRAANGQVTLARGGRTYTVRGLEKNMSFDLLRVNVTVRSAVGLHVDTLDMLSARQRVAFEKAASAELACGEAVVHDDLGALLMALQDLQDDAIKKALAPAPTTPEMTAEARADALELLHDPRLVERIVSDFAAYGIIGEGLNTLTGLLASLSRKLEHPLAV
ncbi:MAG: toprim domain-containing protein, partial [Rhodocyclales bacterium]|nr:toprim domain-containing protein [Rhodocyclales bacterium]